MLAEKGYASPLQYKETPITTAKHIVFDSKILKQTVSINVFIPDSFNLVPTQTYPVILANGGHGQVFFHTLTGITKHLGELDRIPESLVVSINDGGHIPKLYTNGMWGSRETIDAYGDFDLYRQFLKQELFPFLTNQYRANDYRFLIGISGSAIFPLSVIHHEPELFDGYILMASHDMIGMGLKPQQTFLNTLSSFLDKPRKRPGGLFFAVADDDLTKLEAYSKNVDSLKSIVNNAQASNNWAKVDVIGNERHYDIFIKGMLAAFEMWFPEKRWAPKYRDLIAKPGDALNNIEEFYQVLSQEYGITIIPKPNRWNSVNGLQIIGNVLHRAERHSEALAIAKRRKHYTPDDPGAYMQIAQAYEHLSELPNAIKWQKEAIAIARRESHESLNLYEDYLKQLMTSTVSN
jgi:tetratricopeptide (TPR) repeat protein